LKKEYYKLNKQQAMIHISPTKKGKFQVTNVANNGEPLKPSESVESKQSCWKNIRSELKSCYSIDDSDDGLYAVVQDNTVKVPVVWHVGLKKKVLSSRKPQTPYVPQ
jgi:uncharacterized protein YegP (UPF0339 family)